MVPGAPVIKKTERPHPATPLIRGWLVLVAIIVYWARDLIPDGEENEFERLDLRWILIGIAVLVLVAGVAGFFTWYFTRFVIDDEELRIETGAVFKKSKKIPFERLQSVDIIQPLAARIFGLAELRLEAGAGDSTTKLRYLTRSQASRLRDYLLARAHGEQAQHRRVPGMRRTASRYTDLGPADQPLVTVTPDRLVLGLLLSSEWLISATMLIIALVTTIVLDVVQYALGGLIPLAFGVVTMVSRRVIGMFNFTLAESPRGLRITRGLTNLTSQSVPISRIQGVRVVPAPALEAARAGTGSTSTSSATARPRARTTTTRPPACCFRSPPATRSTWPSAACCRASTWTGSSCTPSRAGPAGCGGSTSGRCATAGTTAL